MAPLETRAGLPSRVVNTKYLPVVSSQGSLGICGSFAVFYYLATHEQARLHGWEQPNPSTHPERVASPAWGVLVAPHGTKAGAPAGSHSGEAVESICDFGFQTWAERPYADTMDFREMPSVADMRSALRNKGLAGGFIGSVNTPAGLKALKQHLAAGRLAVGSWAVPLYWNFERYPNGAGISNGVYYRTADGESRKLGHALTAIGYDDDRQYVDDRTGETRTGALLMVNSWGTRWGYFEPSAGSAGFMWVSYDAIMNGQVGSDFFTLSLSPNPYEPELLAEVVLSDPDGNWSLATPPAPWPEFIDISVNGLVPGGGISANDYNYGPNTADGKLACLFDLTPCGDSDLPLLELQGFFMTPEIVGTVDGICVERRNGIATDLVEAPVDVVRHGSSYPVFRHRFSMFREKACGLAGLEPTRGSAAWGDANGDGFPDLAVSCLQAQGARWGTEVNLLYLNDGTGRFAVPQALPLANIGELAWADMDNDGDLDLVCGTRNGTRILTNSGTGAFSLDPVVLPAASLGALAIADADRDGRADVAVANLVEGLLLMRRMPDGSFERIRLPRTILGQDATALAWGDVDGDGLPDLVSASGYSLQFRAEAVLLHRNLGNLEFETLATGVPDLILPALACGDYDNDGHDDLAYSGTAGGSGAQATRRVTGVLMGRAAGLPLPCTLDPDVPPVYAGRLVWADLDNDGSRDLVATGRERETPSSLGYTSATMPFDLAFFNRTRIFRHEGENWFSGTEIRFGGTSGNLGPSLLALADADRDGDVDILEGGCEGGAAGTWVNGSGPPPETVATRLLDSQAGDFFAVSRSQAPPTAPTVLQTVPVAPGALRFTWSGAADDHTPEGGLRYVLRVGTTPGNGDVASGAVVPDANGLLCRSGIVLHNLPVGMLYWSVRTVDAGLAASPWSGERTAPVDGYSPPGRLEIVAAPPTGGTTDPPPGLYRPAVDSQFGILATPAAGYQFDGWDSGGPVPNPLPLTVAPARVLTARFSPKVLAAPSPDWIRVPVTYPEHPWYTWGNRDHVATVFGGAFLIIPGRGYGSNDRIWYSTNGSSWSRSSQLLSDTIGVREGAAAALFNGRLYVMGGFVFAAGDRRDVWSASSDAPGNLNWRLELAQAPWAARRNAGCAVFAGRIWVVGGKENFGAGFSDAWSTDNGNDWTREPDPPWSGRDRTRLVVHDGKMLALIASEGDDPGAVWETTDGQIWTLLTDVVPWEGSDYFSAVSFDGQVHVVFAPDQAHISSDGIFWTRARPSDDQAEHWGPRYGMELAVYKNELWLTGGRNTSTGEFDADVWRLPVNTLPSPYGVLWISASPPEGGQTMPPAGQHTDTRGVAYPVAALPADGWVFDGWDGPVADPALDRTTVTLTEQVGLTARFREVVEPVPEPPPEVAVNLVLSPAAGGIANSATSFNVPFGTQLTLSVSSRDGYRFSHWSGAVDAPLLAATTMTAASNATIVAHFTRSRPCLVAGYQHSAMRNVDGTVWSWGKNDLGQLGSHWRPGPGGMPSLASFSASSVLASGDNALFAVKPDQSVWQIGHNAPMLTAVSAFFAGRVSQAAILTEFGSTKLKLYGPLLAQDVLFPDLPVFQYTRIAIGEMHALGLGGDGRLRAYGNNSSGQLGDGTTDYKSDFVVVNGVPDLVDIVTDGTGLGAFSLGLDRQGQVWSWGANDRGQLGIGGVRATAMHTPQQVEALADTVIAVAVGKLHALALTADGRVYAWGGNESGQLGTGEIADSASPVEIQGLPAIASIAAGIGHSLACAEDGRLYAWGANDAGQANGIPGEDIRAPALLPGLHWGMSPTSLSLGLEAGGYEPVGRGANAGLGTIDPPPGLYLARPGGVVTIEASDGDRYVFDHWTGPVAHPDRALTYVLTDRNATVNAVFRLRPTTTANLSVSVSPAGAGDVSPSPGSYSYPRDTLVQLAAYPKAQYVFQDWLGNAPVPDAGSPSTSITMDRDWSLTSRFALREFRSRPLFRVGQYNLASDGIVRSLASIVPNPPDLRIIDLVHAGHYLELTTDGRVLAWGANDHGQCGTGTVGISVATPTSVVGPGNLDTLTFVDMIGAVEGLSVARQANGTLWAWGRLPGAGVDSPRPTQVVAAGGGTFAAANLEDIAGVGDTLLFLRGDQTVETWGSQYTGVSVRGAAHDVPTRVPALDGTTAIATGSAFALALKGDGSLWSWGSNAQGQLGVGAGTSESDVPLQVPGIPTIVAIFAGSGSAAAVDAAGNLWVWGANSGYDLGIGREFNRDNQYVPVLNSHAPPGIVSVFFAYAAGYAITADRQIWAWGQNGNSMPPDVPVKQGKVGSVEPAVYRRLTFTVDAESAHLTGLAAGMHTFLDGQTVELWARSDDGHQFLRWRLDGVDHDGDRLAVAMTGDHRVEAVFGPAPPLLVASSTDGEAGATSHIAVRLERSTQVYEGLDCLIHVPEPLILADVRADPTREAAGFTVQWQAGMVPDGTVARILAYDIQTPFAAEDPPLLELVCRAPRAIVEGDYPIRFVADGRGGFSAALAWESGSFSLPAETADGVVRVRRKAFVEGRFRVAAGTPCADRLTAEAYAALPTYDTVRYDQPARLELWLCLPDSGEQTGFTGSFTLSGPSEFAGAQVGTLFQLAGGTMDATQVHDWVVTGMPDQAEARASGDWLRAAVFDLAGTGPGAVTLTIDALIVSMRDELGEDLYTDAISGLVSPILFTTTENHAPSHNGPVLVTSRGGQFVLVDLTPGDPDAADAEQLSVTILDPPDHGTFEPEPGLPFMWRYQPDVGFAGSVSFEFEASDGTAVGEKQVCHIRVYRETMIRFASGWAAFTPPGELPDASIEGLAEQATRGIGPVWLSRPAWRWDSGRGCWRATEAAPPHTPLWIPCLLGGDVAIETLPVPFRQIFHRGWNAVGVPAVLPRRPEMRTVWAFRNGALSETLESSFLPGTVYWVFWDGVETELSEDIW